jgi:hypothetical protein
MAATVSFELHSPDGRRFIARADEAGWWTVNVDAKPVGGFLTRELARAVIRAEKVKLGWAPVLHRFIAEGTGSLGDWLRQEATVKK